MNAHGHEVVGRRLFSKKLEHGARELRGHTVDAKGHEVVLAEIAVAGFADVLDELARDVMHREGEKLLWGEAGIAERFHALDVIGTGGECKFAATIAVAEAAVEAHGSGVAAQLKVNRGVFGAGNVAIEADEVADFVGVAPGTVVAPAGALDFEVEASAVRAGIEPGRPVAVNGVVGGAL